MIPINCNITVRSEDSLQVNVNFEGDSSSVDIVQIVALQRGESLEQYADARLVESHSKNITQLVKRIKFLKAEVARLSDLEHLVQEQAVELHELRERLADRDQLIE